MKLLCITDPKTHPPLDGTVGLYHTFAKHPNIQLFHCPASLISSDEAIKVFEVKEPLEYEVFLTLDSLAESEASILDFDLVFCRTDKPYPAKHKENLSLFENRVQFVNRPSSLIRLGKTEELSKICGEFMPEFISSRDTDEIFSFFNKHGKIVAKKNVGYGGKWVYKIWEEDSSYFIDNILEGKREFFDFADLVTHIMDLDPEPYQFVRYLNRVNEGDKRVHVTDGKIMGAILRKTENSSSWVQNLTSGAKAFEAEVDDKEKQIIEATVKAFTEAGIHTLGYDFLVDDDGSSILSEVNVGNIGGYNRYEMLSGRDVVSELAEWLIDFNSRNTNSQP